MFSVSSFNFKVFVSHIVLIIASYVVIYNSSPETTLNNIRLYKSTNNKVSPYINRKVDIKSFSEFFYYLALKANKQKNNNLLLFQEVLFTDATYLTWCYQKQVFYFFYIDRFFRFLRSNKVGKITSKFKRFFVVGGGFGFGIRPETIGGAEKEDESEEETEENREASNENSSSPSSENESLVLDRHEPSGRSRTTTESSVASSTVPAPFNSACTSDTSSSRPASECSEHHYDTPYTSEGSRSRLASESSVASSSIFAPFNSPNASESSSSGLEMKCFVKTSVAGNLAPFNTPESSSEEPLGNIDSDTGSSGASFLHLFYVSSCTSSGSSVSIASQGILNESSRSHERSSTQSAYQWYSPDQDDDGYDGDDESDGGSNTKGRHKKLNKVNVYSFSFKECGNGADCMASPPEYVCNLRNFDHNNSCNPFFRRVPRKKVKPVQVNTRSYLYSFSKMDVLRSSLAYSSKDIIDSLALAIYKSSSIEACNFYVTAYESKQKQKNSIRHTVEAGFTFRVIEPIYYGFSCAQTKLNEEIVERLKAKLKTTYFSNIVLWNPSSSGIVSAIEFSCGLTQGRLNRLYDRKTYEKNKGYTSGLSKSVLAFLGYKIELFDKEIIITPYSKYIFTSLFLDGFQERGSILPAELSSMKDRLQEYHIGIDIRWQVVKKVQLYNWFSVISGTEEDKKGLQIKIVGTEPTQYINIQPKKKRYKQLEIGSSIQFQLTKQAKIGAKLQTRFGVNSNLKYLFGINMSYGF